MKNVYDYLTELTKNSVSLEVEMTDDFKKGEVITIHFSEVKHLPKVGQRTSEYSYSDESYPIISSVNEVSRNSSYIFYEVFSRIDGSRRPEEEHFLWFLCTERRK